MGLLRYGLAAFFRNRGRSIGMAAGIIIAIILISGSSIATESITSFEVLRNLDNTVVDIQVTSPVDDPTGELAILNHIQANNSEIEAVIPIIFATYSSQAILNASGPIDWAGINASQYNATMFEDKVTLGGIDPTIFNSARLAQIITITKGSFPANANQILLDNATANRLGITLGANVTMGAYTHAGGYPYYYSYSVQNFTQDINLTVTGIFVVPSYKQLNT